MADPLEDTYLTVAEIAEMTRMSKMTIYRLVKEQELESIRIGRSYRIPERSLRTYLDGNRKSASGE